MKAENASENDSKMMAADCSFAGIFDATKQTIIFSAAL
jgi:hypothetical protein